MRLFKAARETAAGAPPAVPVYYANVLTDDEFPDHQLPAVLLTTSETAKVTGSGHMRPYYAEWDVKVSVVTRGRTAPETRINASLLEAVVRQCMTQQGARRGEHPQWERPVTDVKWLSAKITSFDASTRKGRYLAAGTAAYNVSTDIAVQGFGGPGIPDADTYLALPGEVTEVTEEVKSK